MDETTLADLLHALAEAGYDAWCVQLPDGWQAECAVPRMIVRGATAFDAVRRLMLALGYTL